MGVQEETVNGRIRYTASIHINGNFIIGHYPTETDAAIAYNKAADILNKKGLQKKFIKNYIYDFSSEDYLNRYEAIKVSEHIQSWNS
jgi:hypothetical protein